MTSYDDGESTLDDPHADRPAHWPPGTRLLNTYEITAAPRSGGMGVVHPAHHLGWKTAVAVKSPHPHLLADRDAFVREARTWAGLGLHPNICACYYVRTIDGFPHVFAEWAEKGSLDHHRPPPQDVSRILDIAIQTAWGLAYAHGREVIHRDVKPGNILVGDQRQVKITDFGLSQAGPGHRGTRLYRSPEQAAGQRTGPATDIWSLAVVVLELLLGETTWYDGQAAGKALTTVRLPEALHALLARCLAHDPADRPAAMTDVAAELIAVHHQVTGRPYGHRQPVAARLRAAELNNQALTQRDLGSGDDEVRRLLSEALDADPRHPEASYNLGMLNWRAGAATPTEVLGELRSALEAGRGLPAVARAEHNERVRRLMALVDAERGQTTSATTIPVTGSSMASVLATLPDGERLLVGHDGGRLTLHDTATGNLVRTFHGHAPVNMVRVSSDGRYAMSSGMDRVVRLWDLDTGDQRGAKKRRGPTAFLTLAPDARAMALQRFGEAPGRVRIWRLDERRLRPYIIHRSGGISSSPLFLGEDTVLVAEEDGAVVVWDWRRGRRSGTLSGHTAPVELMAADRAGRVAVTAAGEEDPDVRVWDVRTRRCLHRLEGHNAKVSALAVSAYGRLALTGDGAQSARLWDLGTGTCVRVLTGHTGVVNVVGFAAGRALTVELGGPARVWDLVSGRCLHTYDRVNTLGTYCGLTPDGRYFFQSGVGEVVVRDLSRRPAPSPLQICRPREIDTLFDADTRGTELVERAVRERDDGNTTAALGLLREARSLPGHERSPEAMAAWREMASTTRPIGFRAAWLSRRLETGDHVISDVRTTPDGRLALTGGHTDGSVWVWDLAAARRVGRLAGHTAPVLALCLTPDGRRVVTAGLDHTARVWDLTAFTHGPADLNADATLTGHSNAVQAVSVTPDGRHAVTGGRDSTVRVWDIHTGTPLHTMTGHHGPVNTVCATPDGRHALSAGLLDGGVRMWDLSSGRCVRVPETYSSGGPTSMCLTSDGHLITATWLDDRWGGVRVRHLPTGRFLHRLGTGGTNTALRAVHSVPVGGFILTAGSDHVLHLWDVASGKNVGRLEGHRCDVNAVHMTADWQHVLAAGHDGNVHIWDVDWELAEQKPG
ncbi:protein kinase [Streptomyces sp. NPDC059853]|uniref:protein kinase domain-containing protein n=1 Tax=Streptomyces sp. NPDC059853 TaxID=3346973 RepID=UPI00364D2E0D